MKRIKFTESEIRKIVRKSILEEQTSDTPPPVRPDGQNVRIISDGGAEPSTWVGDTLTIAAIAAAAGGLFMLRGKVPRNWRGPIAWADNFAAARFLRGGAGAPAILKVTGALSRRNAMTWKQLADRIARNTMGDAADAVDVARRSDDLIEGWQASGYLQMTDDTAKIATGASDASLVTTGGHRTLARRVPWGGGADRLLPPQFWLGIENWSAVGRSGAGASRGARAGTWIARYGTITSLTALTAEMFEEATEIQPFQGLMNQFLGQLEPGGLSGYWGPDKLYSAVFQKPNEYVSYVEALNASNIMTNLTQDQFEIKGYFTDSEVEGFRTRLRIGLPAAMGGLDWITDEEWINSNGKYENSLKSIVSDLSGRRHTIYDLARVFSATLLTDRRKLVRGLRGQLQNLGDVTGVSSGERPHSSINKMLEECTADMLITLANSTTVLVGASAEGVDAAVLDDQTVVGTAGLSGRDITSANISNAMANGGLEALFSALEVARIIQPVECPDGSGDGAALTACVNNIYFAGTGQEGSITPTAGVGLALGGVIDPDSEEGQMNTVDSPQRDGSTREEIVGGAQVDQIDINIEDQGAQGQGRSDGSACIMDDIQGGYYSKLYELFGSSMVGMGPCSTLGQLGYRWIDANFDRWYNSFKDRLGAQIFQVYLKDTKGVTNAKQYWRDTILKDDQGRVAPCWGTLNAVYPEAWGSPSSMRGIPIFKLIQGIEGINDVSDFSFLPGSLNHFEGNVDGGVIDAPQFIADTRTWALSVGESDDDANRRAATVFGHIIVRIMQQTDQMTIRSSWYQNLYTWLQTNFKSPE